MPSIVDGLFSGRAGIQSHGTAISVLADNIANQNTTGFKAARADFTDVLAGSIGGGGSASSTGSGSAVSSITRVQNQGTFETTGRALDVGIDGNGFLIVRNDNNTTFYTRAGNLTVDPEGFLRDQNGLNVIGFPADGSGALQTLNVNERVQQNISTGNLALSGNLNASAAISTLPGGTPSFQQLASSASFQYTNKVYDTLGASHDLTTYFYNSGTTAPGVNTWVAHTYVDAGDVGGVAGAAQELTPSITLNFSSSGALTSAGTATITPAWDNGSAGGSIQIDFSGFTQFASPSTVSSASQDGTGSGSVTGFSISKDGTLVARLDNGQTAAIGTLALATFANAEGLQRIGNSLYGESSASGEAVVGTPDVGIFGSLQSGALELSTSDLAADFIKLISLQRGFQGSSRIVSSVNDLLNEVVNLGR